MQITENCTKFLKEHGASSDNSRASFFLLKYNTKTSQCLKHMKSPTTWKSLKYIDIVRKNKKWKFRQHSENNKEIKYFSIHPF